MHTNILTLNHLSDWTETYYPESQRRHSDIDLGQGLNLLLLGAWMVLCGVGFAVLFLAKKPILGSGIIAIPTFIGMVLKPSFGLCLFMLVLPTGTAAAVEGVFSLNKGVGLAMAAAFILNAVLTRPHLRFNQKALWFALAYFSWVLFSAITNVPFAYLFVHLTSRFQYLGLFFVVYWILYSNKESTFIWALRSYILGIFGTIALAFITGTAIQSLEESTQNRFTSTAAGDVNANVLSAMIAVAFIATIYLLMKERKFQLKTLYALALPLLILFLFKTGSRGTLLGVLAALAFGALGRQILHNPKLFVFICFAIFAFMAGGYFILQKGVLEESVSTRLTDLYLYKEAFASRMEINFAALRIGATHPFGTGLYEWFIKSGLSLYPHNDLLYSMGIYGLPAAFFFACLIICLIIYIIRMSNSPEKLYSKFILIFLIFIGLKGTYVFQKFYWIFLAVILFCGDILKRRHDYKTEYFEAYEADDGDNESYSI